MNNDLTVHCGACGEDFPSELGYWERVYTAGETWSERCPHCGARYAVTLQFTAVEQS